MSRYILIRRLRWPAILLLVGFNALMAQANILDWGHSWPLYLILWGVMMLAERAALAAEGGYPVPPYSGSPYPGAPYAGPVNPASGAPVSQPAAQSSTAIVPANSCEIEKDPYGGQQ